MIDASHKERFVALSIALGLGLAGCSAGGATGSVTQANITTNVLKLSVGTANIFGDMPGAASTGLNVAATFRQPSGALISGASAVLVSQPTFSGPFTLPATAGMTGSDGDPTATVLTGPAPTEIGTQSIGGTPQGGTAVSSFGTSGGVFGLGIEPFNYGDGAPFTNVPYPVPLYDAVAMDPNAFIPWGGPPAFDLAGNGQSVVGSGTEPAGQAGISEGLDVFSGVTPAVGTYALSATIPANTGQPTIKTTATLGSIALLPAITPAVPTLDARGGGTFTATIPGGVTEAYIQVTDIGPGGTSSSCNGASPEEPIYYTLEVTPGSPTGTLPDTAGPGGTQSICTAAQNTTTNMATSAADQYLVQTIGFDYPLYENSYVSSKATLTPSPVLAGGNGQSDITISSAALYPVVAGTSSARHLTKNPIRQTVKARR